MSFGDFLYELRKEKGLTQSEVAEKLGVTNKAVSKWETGETFPETAQLLPLSDLFGVTVDELLRGERRETPVSAAPAEKETPPVALPWSAGQIALLISGIAVILLGLLFIFWVEKYGVCWFMLSTALGAFCFVEFAFLHSAPLSVTRWVGKVCGVIMMLCALVYLLFGYLWQRWDLSSVIFVVGGLLCGIVAVIGSKK